MANANDFLVKNGLVVSTTATIRSDTNSLSTDSGALIVTGGAGVALDLHVGGFIYSPNIVGLITTATNLSGGSLGSIPFQQSSGVTDFINIGSDRYALISNGSTASWEAVVNSLSAGTDTAISSTSGSVVIWNTSDLQTVTDRGASTTNAVSIINQTSSTSTTTGALTVTGGVGIAGDLFVGGDKLTFSGNPSNAATYGPAFEFENYGGDVPNRLNINKGARLQFRRPDYPYDIATISAYLEPSNLNVPNPDPWLILSSKGSVFIQSNDQGNHGEFFRFLPDFVNDRSYAEFPRLNIVGTDTSTSTVTGALTVTGGVGIGGSLYASAIFDQGNRVVTSVTPSGSSYISVDTVTTTGPSTSFTIRNTGVLTLTAGTDTAVSSNTGTITIWNTSTLQSITNRGSTTNNAIGITNTTSATSTLTGALTVAGGVGIQGDLWVGGAITAEQLTIQYTTITSVSTVIDDVTTIRNGDQSFNTQSGALQVWGGVGIGGNLFVGGTINGTIVGSITGIASTASNIAGGTAGQVLYQTAPGATSFFGPGTAGDVLVSNGSSAPAYQNTLTLAGTIEASSTNTGALQVVGGVGVGGSLYAASLYDDGNRVVTRVVPNGSTYIGIDTITSVGTATSFTVKNLGVTNLTGSTYIGISTSTGSVTVTNLGVQTLTAGTDTVVTSNTGTVTVYNNSTLQTVTNRGATTNQAITITNLISTTSTNTGALTVSGGVGIGGGLVVGGTVTATNFVGNIVGTATNSTTATNILGGTAGQVPYQISPSLTGFFGPGAAGNVLVSNGTSAPAYQNTLTLAGATSVSSTNTGALQIVGGVGIGGGAFVGGTVTATLFTGNLTGVATTATNLAGGTLGSIPYQTSTGTTAFIGIGASNTVLFSNGTTATWVSTSSILGAVTVPIATPTVPGTVFGYTTGNGNTAIGCCSGNVTQTGANNFAAGCLSLNANTTGASNIAIGGLALYSNTTGSDNIALGCNALRCNLFGNSNFAAGNAALNTNRSGCNNVAIGAKALESNNTGNNNFAVGNCALAFNTFGSDNFAVGNCALRVNSTGNNNIAVGALAMVKNLIGSNNFAAGYHALYGSIASDGGNDNIGIGYQALCQIDTGVDNIALGNRALSANTYGMQNIALGRCALSSQVTGCGNIAIGHAAGQTSLDGINNISMGYCANGATGCANIYIGNCAGSTTTVFYPTDNIGIGAGVLANDRLGSNIAIGCLALSENTTGFLNIAIGANALQCNRAGHSNVAVGTYGLVSNVCGIYNVAVGDSALISSVVGRCQVAVGASALFCHITGCSNMAVGHGALAELAQGSCNIAVGRRAGCNLTTASSQNTLLGAYNGLHHNCSCNNVIVSDGAGNVRLWFTATGALSFSTATDFGSAGFVLQSNGNSAPPSWQSVGALSAGQATTATNLAGGTTGAIPYQSAPGTTQFIGIGSTGTILQSDGTTATWVSTSSILNSVVVANATPTSLGTVFGYTTGSGNTAIGCCSGNITQTGSNNFAVGCCALRTNSTGNSNIALGYGALFSNTIGTDNFAAGCCALRNNTTGIYNTAIGLGALRSNTGGFGNIAFGTEALCCNLTGSGNIAVGTGALQQNVFGFDNIGIGCQTLQYNSCGTNNIAVGKNAMTGNTAGCRNVAIGVIALCKNTTGNDNIAIGANTLFNNTTGVSNIGIGCNSGCDITTGSFNVIIGSNAGSGIATSSCNIIISDGLGTARICATSTGSVLIPSTNLATSTQTGALQVAGGIGVAASVFALEHVTPVGFACRPNSLYDISGAFVHGQCGINIGRASGGSLTFGDGSSPGVIYGAPTYIRAYVCNDAGTCQLWYGTGSGLLIGNGTSPGAKLDVVGTARISNEASVTTATNATSTNTGALVVTGGVGIGKDVWVGGDLNVRGATTFQGAVTFTGTSTNIFSTNTVYTDNLINMHVPPGGIDALWTVDDGRDIGLVFHYYKGQDKNAFLGLNNADGYLEWFSDGTEVGAVYTGTEFGIFKTGGIVLVGGTTSSSISTGDLVTAGGVGIGGNLWVGGTINASVTGVSTTATNLAGGTTGAIPYQTAPGATQFINIGAVNTVLTSNGTTATWVATQPGATIVDNTTTNATYYPVFSTSTSGAFAQATVSSTKLTWNPSTGQLNVVDINTTSDIAAKENIEEILNPLDLLKSISGFSFNWRDTGAKSYGVIAQYLEKILPELVSEDSKGLKSVKYLPLIAILIESVKKLSAEIEEMKKAGK